MQTISRPPDDPGPRLPPPDPLSTVLLYVGAVVMALDSALAPGSNISLAAPILTMGGVWPFIPIVLMCVAAIVCIVRGLRIDDRRESDR